MFAANKDAVLYVGGSKDAFYANFQIPVTTIVSLKASLRCCTFANSFSRNSGLLRLEPRLFRYEQSIHNYTVFFQSLLAPCIQDFGMIRAPFYTCGMSTSPEDAHYPQRSAVASVTRSLVIDLRSCTILPTSGHSWR